MVWWTWKEVSNSLRLRGRRRIGGGSLTDQAKLLVFPVDDADAAKRLACSLPM